MNVMILAVQKAARGLIRDFGELEKLQSSKKSFGNFVTTADQRAEAMLIDELSNSRQEYSILSEERGEIQAVSPLSRFDQNGGYRWIIDPLDGTMNFWHGIPHFAISVALERFGETIAGVIYNPVTNELFWAEKGKGAFLNNQRIRVSGRRSLDTLLIGIGSPSSFRDDARYLKLNALAKKVGAIRNFGAISLDLAFVAAGRIDAFFEKSVPLWDKAAGSVIILEAGGTIIDNGEGIIAGSESGVNVLQKSAILTNEYTSLS
jgi:myo-inositol-1(or 4)-monophosphatase